MTQPEIIAEWEERLESFQEVIRLRGEEIERLTAALAEAEKRAWLFMLDKYPVTVCPECDGTMIPKPPKQPYCCPIGHAKTCICLLCQWRRAGYEKDNQIATLTQERDRERDRLAECWARAETGLNEVSQERDAAIARAEKAEATLLHLWDSYVKDGNGEPPTFGRPNIAAVVNSARIVVNAIRAAKDKHGPS